MRTLNLMPTLLLVACGGGLSDEDIEEVFQANTTVLTDVQTQVSTAQNSAKELSVTSDSEGWAVTGSIEGTGLWSGTITVDGSGMQDTGAYSYALDLGYEAVDVSGYVLDGTSTYDLEWTSDMANYSIAYAVKGDFDISGEAEGSAEIDYSVAVEVDPQTGQYSYTFDGTINGQDVSGFSAGAGTGQY